MWFRHSCIVRCEHDFCFYETNTSVEPTPVTPTLTDVSGASVMTSVGSERTGGCRQPTVYLLQVVYHHLLSSQSEQKASAWQPATRTLETRNLDP